MKRKARFYNFDKFIKLLHTKFGNDLYVGIDFADGEIGLHVMVDKPRSDMFFSWDFQETRRIGDLNLLPDPEDLANQAICALVEQMRGK